MNQSPPKPSVMNDVQPARNCGMQMKQSPVVVEKALYDGTSDLQVKEIDDMEFEALDGSHNDISIPSSIVDTQQPIMYKPFYESAKVNCHTPISTCLTGGPGGGLP
ncbi:hypothetical protein HanIR_Chr15g0753451 [Helianthus annuus]|nr:hypothetical protein HanIR_Chr15g0753451 [Helianthus annuus]